MSTTIHNAPIALPAHVLSIVAPIVNDQELIGQSKRLVNATATRYITETATVRVVVIATDSRVTSHKVETQSAQAEAAPVALVVETPAPVAIRLAPTPAEVIDAFETPAPGPFANISRSGLIEILDNHSIPYRFTSAGRIEAVNAYTMRMANRVESFSRWIDVSDWHVSTLASWLGYDATPHPLDSLPSHTSADPIDAGLIDAFEIPKDSVEAAPVHRFAYTAVA